MLTNTTGIVTNGVVISDAPLPEGARVAIQVEPKAQMPSPQSSLASSWVEESYGLCGWKGDASELRRLALAPELDLEGEQ